MGQPLSGELRAESRTVAADQVYRPRESLAIYVVDVVRGFVVADVYDGTTRGERIRIPRATLSTAFH